MAMALAEIARPLTVVDDLFRKCEDPTLTVRSHFAEKDHFRQVLKLDDEEQLAKIPCLNDIELAESVPPYSLVRYRCLVQDVFEPEFYVAVFEEIDESNGSRGYVTSKYRERAEVSPGRRLQELEGHAGLSQRGACYCVPLPGEVGWSRAAALEWTVAHGGAAKSVQAPAAVSASKRRRDDDDVNMTAPEDEVPQKARIETAVANSQGISPALAPMTSVGHCGVCSDAGLRTAEDFGLNFPIPTEEQRGRGSSTACIVKLYDDDAEALRVCDIVELVGILCVDPEIADLSEMPGQMEDEWRDARNPSTALVPRLHTLAIRRLPFYHPLLPYSTSFLTEDRLAAAFLRQFALPGALMAARTAAIDLLTKHLAGDVLAAEYMLMLLVSRSFAKFGEKSLGTWSLNLAKWPRELDCNGFVNAASDLVPRAVRLEVTGDTLNSRRWSPKKNFVANRLEAAQLQLAPGTLLMLDETKMMECQLSPDGTKNLLAIQSLVSENVLPCDFQSYSVKIPVELSCVLMSSRSSIIKDASIRLPVRPTPSNAPSPASLDQARWLVGLVTRSPRPLNIPDEITRAFGEDFHAVRQEFSVCGDELAHTWMSLARARCLSFGEKDLTLQRWREVLELERQRLCRCREDGIPVA
mmetsp:Transcript_45587/g.71130  ORF Transcript_45587/g.71130 Transcript_45587/m.71130 type:complete len:639 (+) Transcript_45587:66-1982(+)